MSVVSTNIGSVASPTIIEEEKEEDNNDLKQVLTGKRKNVSFLEPIN